MKNVQLPKPDYVVAIIENGLVARYYGVDAQSGGYPSYSDSLKWAEHYDDKAKAQAIVDRLNEAAKKERTAPYRDGVLYPKDEIRWALELHTDKKPKASGEAVVLEIQATVVYNIPIQGEISKPVGVTYKYD